MTVFDEMAPERAKPGRKGVTAEQVFAAADSIRASRREPTVDAEQKLLGTGSTGTVATHLRTWRSGKDGMVPTAAIPDTMVKALQAFAESACSDVSKQWQARMQPVLEDNITLTETVGFLQDEKDRQAEEVVQKRSERDELQGRCQQQIEEIQRLRDAELLARSEKTEVAPSV